MSQFTVLLTVYLRDNGEWFSRALDSIYFSQIRKPDEIVIVADGELSEDLESVLSSFSLMVNHSREIVKIFRLPENYGLGYALSYGLDFCSGDYVARMDADDISLESRFLRQFNFLDENPHIDILGSASYEIDQFGEIIGQRAVPSSHHEIIALLWTCPIIHPTVVFRKSLVESVGAYSKKLKRRQDYDLWFRCAIKGATFANLDTPCLQYRVTSESYTRKKIIDSWRQAIIGLKGSMALSLGFKAYVGVFFPFLKCLLPMPIRRKIDMMMARFDPRGGWE
ncbi:glycosyltransferase [Stutzerimonas stutzeri]|uniref:glycosyltransferase n=1 Tax=Stutzerimonas stutzeri TaxID=316 RepID=UPI0031DB6FF8